jgi:hypothetical protein
MPAQICTTYANSGIVENDEKCHNVDYKQFRSNKSHYAHSSSQHLLFLSDMLIFAGRLDSPAQKTILHGH